MVVKSCNQVTMKLGQQQLESEEQRKQTTAQCATNLDTLKGTLEAQRKQRQEIKERIEASQATVGNAMNGIKESQKRTAALEEANARLRAQRLKDLQGFESRETDRYKYVDLIQKAVNIMCQLDDYKTTPECSTELIAETPRVHVRYVDGKHGNVASGTACVIPFTYNGKEYIDCIGNGYGGHGWCSADSTYSSRWGSCSPSTLTTAEITREAARSKSIEPALSQAFAQEAPTLWEVMDDVDFLQEDEGASAVSAAQDSSVATIYQGMVQGEVAKLQAAMKQKDQAVARELLAAVLKIRKGIQDEGEVDAKKWLVVEQGYRGSLKSSAESINEEHVAVRASRQQIDQTETALNKDRTAHSDLETQGTISKTALSAERLRCWQAEYEHSVLTRDRNYDLTVLDTLRTLMRDKAAVCKPACATDSGLCVFKGDTDDTYCACAYKFYGGTCEHQRCPGMAIPGRGEGLEAWKPAPRKEGEKVRLFEAHDPWSCSGHGVCDSRTGKCDATCIPSGKVCEHPNLAAGDGAVLVEGMSKGSRYTLQEATALCNENVKCLAFSFPGVHGQWDKDGKHIESHDAETHKGVVNFYSNAKPRDLSGKEWGMAMYMKATKCPRVRFCTKKSAKAGPKKTLVEGLPNGSLMSIGAAKDLCRSSRECTGISFPDPTGYFDTQGVKQDDFFVDESGHGKVLFLARPDSVELEGRETGMTIYTKCGPGTVWMDSNKRWMTERKEQRSHAGKLSSECRWGFESKSMDGWTEAPNLQCKGAFKHQPVSTLSCGADGSGKATAVTKATLDDKKSDNEVVLMPGGLGVGKGIFEDRGYTIEGLDAPLHENLAGATTLTLRDTAAMKEHTTKFTIDTESRVYVWADKAAAAAAEGGIPAWMKSDFVRADGVSIKVGGRGTTDRMVAFRSKKPYPAGEVKIGPVPALATAVTKAKSSSGKAVTVLEQLKIDSAPYPDKAMKVVSVPQGGSYGELVEFPCVGAANQDLDAAYDLSFTTAGPSRLYILLDTDTEGAESGDLPDWLSGYTRVTDLKFEVKKSETSYKLIAFRSSTSVSGDVKLKVPKLKGTGAKVNILVIVQPQATMEMISAKPVACTSQGSEGSFFVRSDMAADGTRSTAMTGVLQSDTFRVSSGAKLKFLIAGGKHPWPEKVTDASKVSCSGGDTDKVVAVNLERNVEGKWMVARTATGDDSENFKPVEWDVSDLGGDVLRIRAYDLATDEQGFIAADSFEISHCKQTGDGVAPVKALDIPIAGGGWELVRRVKPGNRWHPASDNLKGTEVYGKAATEYPLSDLTFSVKFDDKDFDQFLFASGDMKKWMVVDRTALTEKGSDIAMNVVLSSQTGQPYTVKGNNRKDTGADPMIGLTDFGNATSHGEILYMEAGSGGGGVAKLLPIHNGANVFIRKASTIAGAAGTKAQGEYQAENTLIPGTNQSYVAVGKSLYLVYDLQTSQYVDRFRIRCADSKHNPTSVKVSYSTDTVSGSWVEFGSVALACPADSDAVWFTTPLQSITRAQYWKITAENEGPELEIAEVQFHGRDQRPRTSLDEFVKFENKELDGQAYETLKGYNRELCGEVCLSDPSCLSFNYDSGNHACALSKKTHEDTSDSFQTSSTLDYYVKQSDKYDSGPDKACELTMCPGAGKCNNKGTCSTATGLCTCGAMNHGKGCQFTRCPASEGLFFANTNPMSCSARGECLRRSGKCKCRSQYSGKGCEHKTCPQNCRGAARGTCNPEDGTCVCKEGFTGHSCGKLKCPKDCNGHGVCDENTGTCSCHSGFSGKECVQDQPCQSVTANWWDSLNKEGWSTCPSSTLMTGLYRNNKGCEGLFCIEMARCSVPCVGAVEKNLGRCQNVDWHTTMAGEGWSRCPTGFFLQGLYRSSCHSLYCLQQARCCEVHDSEWDKCSSASWQAPMSDKGWAYAGGSLFLTGLYRTGSKEKNGANGIGEIKMAGQCNFRKRPVVKYCGDGKRDEEEKCDDGNQHSGDGCSSTCQVENGWRCRDSNTPLVVSSLAASTGSDYQVMPSGLGAGRKYYTDQSYTIKASTKYDNEYTIMTKDADKTTNNLKITFKVNQRVHVYALLDSKSPNAASGPLPSWMNNQWVRTADKVYVAGRGQDDHFVVFRAKHIKQGTVTVGPITPAVATTGANVIVVVRRAICSEVVPYRKGTAKLVGRMSYQTLSQHLDRDSSGQSVCGEEYHVCNYQEATAYGVIHREDLGGSTGWIVGSTADWEGHRRSLWNGEDSTQCRHYKAPRWWGRWGPYRGRIHCHYKSQHAAVACCSTAPDRQEAAVKAVGNMNYWSLNTKLNQDWQGRSVCGQRWHVCNYAEASVYGAMRAHTFEEPKLWIVGSFSSWEKHRRSIWNGQDNTLCKNGRYPTWLSKRGPYHGTVHCHGGAEVFPVACCADRLQQAAARYADRLKKVGHSSFWSLSHKLNRDWRGKLACGAGWHVCNTQEVMAYGTYYHANLGGHQWTVGGFSNWDLHRRSIWNGQDSTQCRGHHAPLWYSGKWGPYYGMVHCVHYNHRAPAACCANSGFPATAVGELNIAPFAEVSTSKSSSGGSSALVDGTKDYSAGKAWTTASPLGQSSTFDFGAQVELFKLVIYNHNQAAGSDVKQFLLQVSNDASSWRDVSTSELTNTAGATPNKAQKFHIMDHGRYWKVTIKAVHTADKSSGFAEIELYKEGSGTDLNLFKEFKGHLIKDNTLRTLTNHGRMQCATACSDDAKCKSFSYYNGKKKCDLHTKNRNVGDKYVANDGTDFYEKLVDKHSSGYCRRKMIDYRGTIAVTKSGLECQKWTSMVPHEHTKTPEAFPGTGLGDHNYCRNPTGIEQGAWCYTTDEKKTWELCEIPQNPACVVRYSSNIRGGGGNYRREPAVRLYSQAGPASLRVESRNSGSPMEVYIELRNRRLSESWGIGMNDDLNLWFCYGRLGTMNKAHCTMKIEPSGKVHILGYARFHKDAKTYFGSEEEEEELGSDSAVEGTSTPEVPHVGQGSTSTELKEATAAVDGREGPTEKDLQLMHAAAHGGQWLPEMGHKLPTAEDNRPESTNEDTNSDPVTNTDTAVVAKAHVAPYEVTANTVLAASRKLLAADTEMALLQAEDDESAEDLSFAAEEEQGAVPTADKEIGGNGRQEPAATWFSNDNDCSFRIESRDKKTVHPAYFELRNQDKEEAWGIGMGSDLKLRFAYGQSGSMPDKKTAIEIHEGNSRKVVFPHEVEFHSRPRFPSVEVPDFRQKLKVGSVVALKGGHQRGAKYCADEYNQIRCNRNGIGQWEKFTVGDVGDGRIGLKGGQRGKWCADEGNTIKCNRNRIGQWEKFRAVDAGGGLIGLRGGQTNRLCADEYWATKCNRNHLGQWEKFTVECLSNCASKEEARDLEEALGEASGVPVQDDQAEHNDEWQQQQEDLAQKDHQEDAEREDRAAGHREDDQPKQSQELVDSPGQTVQAPAPTVQEQAGAVSLLQGGEGDKEGALDTDGTTGYRRRRRRRRSYRRRRRRRRRRRAWSYRRRRRSYRRRRRRRRRRLPPARRRFTGTLTQNTYGQSSIDPAVTYYSNDNDASIRIESLHASKPMEVYLELREKDDPNGWKMGMNDDYDLHIGWGTIGTANGMSEAIKMTTTGGIEFKGVVEFKGGVKQTYASQSGLQCAAGKTVVGQQNRWSGWSTCATGYAVVGLQGVFLHNSKDSNRGKYQDIDHYQCDSNGCRAWCRSDKCDVVARCCKTPSSPLRCHSGQYKHQSHNRWGSPAYCAADYTAMGLSLIHI
eukprot:TRINITY_DN13620_c0_g2_i4.p1 TRINITY_DN13620_c0_g2~~TRINITY_DN13620_c0_g2_i4.p1  ORF type:complete len:3743 (-),score=834.31 TRINITY_DN13620_c0_g2_i4:156-11384(-)